MNTWSFRLLRIGLGISFVWLGVSIFQDPLSWGELLHPWALALLPVSIQQAMFVVAVLNISIGVLMIFNIFTGLAALFAALHIILVLVATDVGAHTPRDVGLLGATLALMIAALKGKR